MKSDSIDTGTFGHFNPISRAVTTKHDMVSRLTMTGDAPIDRGRSPKR